MTGRPAILGGPPVRAEEPSWPPRHAGTDAALRSLAETGDWGRYDGPHAEGLRWRLRERHGVEYVHTCAGGTAAVELALIGVGVRPGDEVVLAAWDFKANLANVIALGAKPVLVDVRADDAQMDAAQLPAAFTDKTRAVLVSHLHGAAADARRLAALCESAGVSLVEDVCQTPLADVQSRPAGTWGDAAALSFGGSKTLSAGRGGAVLTAEGAVYQRIRLHTLRGNDVSPISEMQAAILNPQVDLFDERLARRWESAARLRLALAGPGLRPLPAGEGRVDCYKLGFVYDPAAWSGLTRATFCEAMHAEGVTLSPSFAALHLTHSARRFRAAGPLEEAGAAGKSVVALHHPVLLEGGGALDEVVAAAAKVRHHAPEIRAAEIAAAESANPGPASAVNA